MTLPTGITEIQRAPLNIGTYLYRIYYFPDLGKLCGLGLDHATRFDNLNDLTQQTDVTGLGVTGDMRYNAAKGKIYVACVSDTNTVLVKAIDPTAWTASTVINDTQTGKGQAYGIDFDDTYFYLCCETGYLHRYRVSDFGFVDTIDFTGLAVGGPGPAGIYHTRGVRVDGAYIFVTQYNRNDSDPCFILRINRASFTIEDYKPVPTITWITEMMAFNSDHVWIGCERSYPYQGQMARVRKTDLADSQNVSPGFSAPFGESWGPIYDAIRDILWYGFTYSNGLSVVDPVTMENHLLATPFPKPWNSALGPDNTLYVVYATDAFISRFSTAGASTFHPPYAGHSGKPKKKGGRS